MSIQKPCECCGARESAFTVTIGNTSPNFITINMCGPCRNFIRLYFPSEEGKGDEEKNREVGFRTNEKEKP